MAYYPYTIPDEAVEFIEMEFMRFSAPLPSKRAVDKIGDYIIQYVIKNNYYPTSEEASNRYLSPGMTEPEKYAILAKLEYELKVGLREQITFDQIHLAAWAAMLYCWSEGAEENMNWFRRVEYVQTG